jgi:release factor glutamine methyltransferase
MTIEDWLQDATTKLTAKEISSARLDALLLLEHVLITPRVTLLSHPETDLPATTLVKLGKALDQRLNGVPIAYIQNKKEFYGRDFIVNEHVLIPRPETESIIELAKSLELDAPRVLDIGTGSGCIAVTLAIEVPKSKVFASDISDEALKIARLNAKSLGARVSFTYADLLAGFEAKQFDVICANLPYVPKGLVTSPEIAKEPELALFSGTDGLHHYERLFNELSIATNKPSFIITESLTSQHSTLKKLATLAGYQLVKTDVLAQLFQKI